MPDTKRVNHRAAERYLCARIRAGEAIHAEDLIYLCDRIIALRDQLEATEDSLVLVNDLGIKAW